jgi:hypothetical protein
MLVIPARVKVVVVMVSALAIAAGLLTLSLLAKPAQAQAQPITSTDRDTVSRFLIGCPPDQEGILVDGTLHTVSHTNIDANGGFHTKVLLNFQGQGVGEITGDKYVFQDVFNLQINEPGPLEETQTRTLKATRQGSATEDDDLQLKSVIHLTLLANGEVTAEVRQFEVVCR